MMSMAGIFFIPEYIFCWHAYAPTICKNLVGGGVFCLELWRRVGGSYGR